jgi:hypothetical protein
MEEWKDGRSEKWQGEPRFRGATARCFRDLTGEDAPVPRCGAHRFAGRPAYGKRLRRAQAPTLLSTDGTRRLGQVDKIAQNVQGLAPDRITIAGIG